MGLQSFRDHNSWLSLFSSGLDRLSLTLLCFLLFSLPSSSWAESWRADLKNTCLPGHFVAVDKERHKFFFLEKNNPLQPTYEFPCMTGQRPGDKQIVNDLKTPEGIYFIQTKIANGLDFKEYGGNKEAAKKVGQLIAKRALDKKIKDVVFDRGGYIFHGRVKELAEGAREGGLNF